MQKSPTMKTSSKLKIPRYLSIVIAMILPNLSGASAGGAITQITLTNTKKKRALSRAVGREPQPLQEQEQSQHSHLQPHLHPSQIRTATATLTTSSKTKSSHPSQPARKIQNQKEDCQCQCSCSPTSYQFRFHLDRDCLSHTNDDSSWVGTRNTLCWINYGWDPNTNASDGVNLDMNQGDLELELQLMNGGGETSIKKGQRRNPQDNIIIATEKGTTVKPEEESRVKKKWDNLLSELDHNDIEGSLAQEHWDYAGGISSWMKSHRGWSRQGQGQSREGQQQQKERKNQQQQKQRRIDQSYHLKRRREHEARNIDNALPNQGKSYGEVIHPDVLALSSFTNHQQPRQRTPPKNIALTSILFVEFDDTSSMKVINQDSTFFSLDDIIVNSDGVLQDTPSNNGNEESFHNGIGNGDVIVMGYKSISNKLDPSTPLCDQLEYVPGGIMLHMYGIDLETLNTVKSLVVWGFDDREGSDGKDEGGCGCLDESDSGIKVGDSIGWVEIVGINPPKSEFCNGDFQFDPSTTEGEGDESTLGNSSGSGNGSNIGEDVTIGVSNNANSLENNDPRPTPEGDGADDGDAESETGSSNGTGDGEDNGGQVESDTNEDMSDFNQEGDKEPSFADDATESETNASDIDDEQKDVQETGNENESKYEEGGKDDGKVAKAHKTFKTGKVDDSRKDAKAYKTFKPSLVGHDAHSSSESDSMDGKSYKSSKRSTSGKSGKARNLEQDDVAISKSMSVSIPTKSEGPVAMTNLNVGALQSDNDSGLTCSCSPTTYNMKIRLDLSCANSTVDSNTPGINSTFCLSGNANAADGMDRSIDNRSLRGSKLLSGEKLSLIKNQLDVFGGDTNQEENIRGLNGEDAVFSYAITQVLFIETDTSNELTIIRQVSLAISVDEFISNNGVLIASFESIASQLDPVKPLKEQLEYLPGTAGVIVFVKNSDGEISTGEFFWGLDTNANSCGVLPELNGKRLGWVQFIENIPANPDVCDDIPTESPLSQVTTAPQTMTPTLVPISLITTPSPTYFRTASTSSSTKSSKSSQSSASKQSKYVAESPKSMESSKSEKGYKYIAKLLKPAVSTKSGKKSQYVANSLKLSASSSKSGKDSKARYYNANTSSFDSVGVSNGNIASGSPPNLFNNPSKSSKLRSISPHYVPFMDSREPMTMAAVDKDSSFSDVATAEWTAQSREGSD